MKSITDFFPTKDGKKRIASEALSPGSPVQVLLNVNCVGARDVLSNAKFGRNKMRMPGAVFSIRTRILKEV